MTAPNVTWWTDSTRDALRVGRVVIVVVCWWTLSKYLFRLNSSLNMNMLQLSLNHDFWWLNHIELLLGVASWRWNSEIPMTVN
jgi:lysozyme family protein